MMAARPEDRFASYDDLLRAIDLASAAHTRPAGFLARALATGLDFLLVALVIGGAFELLRALGAGDREDKPLQLLGFAAYQALAVARWGRTAGKALFELEVVATATLARPARPLAIRRALAMLGVPTLAWSAHAVVELAGLSGAAELLEAVAVLAVALGPALLLHATTRVAGKRAPWDRLSGTMVRYRTPRPPEALSLLLR